MYELKDTIKMMQSNDYKERFIAEYWQTKIRYEKLKHFVNRIHVSKITMMPEPEHDCPLEMLQEQQTTMGKYLSILEKRAIIEGVDLYVDRSTICKSAN